MRRFKSSVHAERFLSVFGIISSPFRVGDWRNLQISESEKVLWGHGPKGSRYRIFRITLAPFRLGFGDEFIEGWIVTKSPGILSPHVDCQHRPNRLRRPRGQDPDRHPYPRGEFRNSERLIGDLFDIRDAPGNPKIHNFSHAILMKFS
jgi:hypothetical protein